ncbi:phage tail protein [Nocardia brasiliensis]|uniref:phage tail protein n=1 Tax=Nocardia brasiliensis TaxID=37326 RepID=UPI002455C726|nr:phage tail protein [Nocardia brasiliensis]
MPSGLTFEFESWRSTDDIWTIHGEGAGDRGIYLGTNPEGLYDEPTESIWNSYAYQIGADFGGIRIHKREVILGVEAIATPYQSWQRNDSDFRKAWSYKKDSRLRCLTDDWGLRYLRLRLSKTPDFSPDTDPFKDQYGHVIYSGTAGFPRWQEDDVTAVWVSTTDTTNGEWTDGVVKVSNPTDTEMWLKWVLQAYPGVVYKLPDFSFGDDRFERASEHANRKITMPALVAGEHLRVDTDENADQVVSDIDTQAWQRMRGIRFLYPIPPGTQETLLPVSVKNAPAGVGVQVRCPRNWSRPWGLD